MELHQLRYFVAVADLASFTKAAERCLVAQPSLSQQIIKLEKELGQPLLERLGRTVRLTDAGRCLYEQATQILGAVEDTKRRLSDIAADDAGTIAVGAIPTVAPYLLPPLVSEFQRRYPRSNVVIQENFTAGVIEGCLRGELDVGLLALPISDRNLTVEPLFEEELLLAVPCGHPLAEKPEVTVADVNEQAFILLSEMHCLGETIVSYCRQQSCNPLVTCQGAQLQTVQELVSIGHGISLVPDMAAERNALENVRYRRLTGEIPTRTLAMIYHKHRRPAPQALRFMELVRERAATMKIKSDI